MLLVCAHKNKYIFYACVLMRSLAATLILAETRIESKVIAATSVLGIQWF